MRTLRRPTLRAMGKGAPASRGGNGTKKKAIAKLTAKKTIVKAPREIRDMRIQKKGDASSMDIADGSTASAGRKKSKPGKKLRKAQRKLSGAKKATRAKKEKRKHIN